MMKNMIGQFAPATFVYDEVAGEIKLYEGIFRDEDYYRTVLNNDNLTLDNVFDLLRSAYSAGISQGSSNIRNQIKTALGLPTT
jgi:hypothetical protein